MKLGIISCLFTIIAVLCTQYKYGSAFRSAFRGVGGRAITRNVHFGLSMANKEINMPALSSTMKEGKIVAWSKKIGDKVSAGDILLIVESDKADMDVEAFDDGFLAAINVPEGGSAAVGEVVAVLVDTAAEVATYSKGGSAAVAPAAPVPTPAAPPAASSSSSASVAAPSVPFERILMPALSSTMKEGKVVSWSKKVGDKISSGDMALVVESDKADMDVESYEDGYLAAVLVGEGEIATVGAPVGLIVKSKDDVNALQAYAAALKSGGGSLPEAVPSSGSSPAAVAPPVSATPAAAAPMVVNDGRVAASGYAKAQAKEAGIDLRTVTPSRPDGLITSKDLASGSQSSSSSSSEAAYVPGEGVVNASPMARKLASDNGLDVTKIKGSGNFGRVVPDDVLRAAGKLPVAVVAAPAPAPAVAVAVPTAAAGKTAKPAAANAVGAAPLDGFVAMDGMQKAVAKNMERTLSIPVFRVSRDIVTDGFDALYAQLKPKGVTVSAMLAKAVAEVLKKHPLVNAAYDGEKGGIIYHKDVNVAMAVAIDGGLITPTIIGAQDMDLFAISRTWKDLVDRAKSKKLTPKEYSSGTFTISNLGMFGVGQFDAILPPGTGSILAIAASTPKVVQQKNGYLGVQKSMTVTITCDHRHIYGAHAAEFLKDLADLLENNPQSLVMG